MIIAGHGNSLRALIMVLDQLTPETIPGMELETGVPHLYRLKPDSTVESKEILNPKVLHGKFPAAAARA